MYASFFIYALYLSVSASLSACTLWAYQRHAHLSQYASNYFCDLHISPQFAISDINFHTHKTQNILFKENTNDNKSKIRKTETYCIG